MARNSFDINQKPDETLEQYFRRLAKTADQRLVRLERYKDEKYFKTAETWAYARAKKDIRKWNKGEVPEVYRFNVNMPKGENLVAKINDIKTFLEAPTSTKQGVIDVYKKRADTVNKRYGTNFTWKQLAKYYDSGQADLWDQKFGSKTALRTIAAMQKNKSKIKKQIKEADKKDIRVDNKVIDKTIQMALKDNQLNIEDLL